MSVCVLFLPKISDIMKQQSEYGDRRKYIPAPEDNLVRPPAPIIGVDQTVAPRRIFSDPCPLSVGPLDGVVHQSNQAC